VGRPSFNHLRSDFDLIPKTAVTASLIALAKIASTKNRKLIPTATSITELCVRLPMS